MVRGKQKRRTTTGEKLDHEPAAASGHAFGSAAIGDAWYGTIDRSLLRPSFAGRIHRQSFDRSSSWFYCRADGPDYRILCRRRAGSGYSAHRTHGETRVADHMDGRRLCTLSASQFRGTITERCRGRSSLRIDPVLFRSPKTVACIDGPSARYRVACGGWRVLVERAAPAQRGACYSSQRRS